MCIVYVYIYIFTRVWLKAIIHNGLSKVTNLSGFTCSTLFGPSPSL